MRKNREKKSVSLVEVIVAAVILSMAFGGLFASFIAARSYRTYSNERTIAANLARRGLEDLYDGVSADTWDDLNSTLRPGVTRNDGTHTVGGLGYNSGWTISTVGSHQYRSVAMDIQYTNQSQGSTIGGNGGGNLN